MIIDLRDIKRQGKDEIDFFFECDLDSALINLPNVTFNGKTKLSGTAVLTGEHSAFIECDIEFSLEGDCTGCLESTSRSYLASFREEFGDNTENSASMKGDRIDLTAIVNETVMANMPYNFLCSDECKGLCPVCGTNLNKEKCNCNNK